MAGGFPLVVNDVPVRTSEALYQACRFPHIPKVQREIIAQKSPMAAKMKGKPHRSKSRTDWDMIQIKIMRWCLEVKLAQNWDKFSELLLDTGDMPIVELSRRDDFWEPTDWWRNARRHQCVGPLAYGTQRESERRTEGRPAICGSSAYS